MRPEIAIPVFDEMMTSGLRQGEGLLELRLRTITINKSGGSMPEAFADFGIEVVSMSDVGHFVMLEDPKTFNRLLLEAIEQLIKPEDSQ